MFRNQVSQKSPRVLYHGWWRLAVGGWRLAVGGWRLAVGNWWLVAVGGGWRRLVVGDWWLVAVGSSWQLAVGRRWRTAAVGGWRLVALGGWQLAVGGPLGRSLRAVLSQKKKSRPLRTALPAVCQRLVVAILRATLKGWDVGVDGYVDDIVSPSRCPLGRSDTHGRARPHTSGCINSDKSKPEPKTAVDFLGKVLDSCCRTTTNTTDTLAATMRLCPPPPHQQPPGVLLCR